MLGHHQSSRTPGVGQPARCSIVRAAVKLVQPLIVLVLIANSSPRVSAGGVIPFPDDNCGIVATPYEQWPKIANCSDPKDCFGDKRNFRISGGLPIADGEFPAYVLVKIRHGAKEWQCGGTIMAPKVVMTAASCLYDGGKFPNQITVIHTTTLAGYQGKAAAESHEFNMICLNRHYGAWWKDHKYHNGRKDLSADDYALLTASSPDFKGFEQNRTHSSACLSHYSVSYSAELWVVGLGKSRGSLPEKETGTLVEPEEFEQPRLHAFKAHRVKCPRTRYDQVVHPKATLCIKTAHPTQRYGTACERDQGGAIYTREVHSGRVYMVGIIGAMWEPEKWCTLNEDQSEGTNPIMAAEVRFHRKWWLQEMNEAASRCRPLYWDPKAIDWLDPPEVRTPEVRSFDEVLRRLEDNLSAFQRT